MGINPLVSVLIPNYNKAAYLKETLDSVLAQTYTNWECIIVDDHSTDNSWEILEEYAAKDSRFKIFKRPDTREQGGNAARNFAFEMSKGVYVNWFDSDDIMLPDKIEKQIYFLEYSEVDFVLVLIENYKNDFVKSEFVIEMNKEKRPIKYLKGTFWFQTSLPIFKRKFLLVLNRLFDESLKRNQEGEFFTRILLAKPEIYFINDKKVIRRFDNNSISSNYSKLTIAEKIKLDYPSILSLFNLFRKKIFFGIEEKEYFVNWFIFFIQYSDFNIYEIFRFLLKSLFYGVGNQKIIAFKSYIKRISCGV